MRHFIHRIPISVNFSEEGDLNGLNLHHLGQYLTEKTHIPFHLLGNIYKRLSEERTEAIAERLARIRVRDPGQRFISAVPLPAEMDYEKRKIRSPGWKTFGIFYEGVLYQEIVSDLIYGGELDFNHCSILLTNQLFGTWDRDDQRYHARASLYGFPSILSITGLVEAPAKPKEFYLKKQMGLPLELLKEEYQDRFLNHGDPRIAEVLKGYIMQALLFHLTGDPFCEDRDCRLFNSHWQEEVLRSQMDGRYEFCPRHEAVLKELRKRS